MSQLLLLWLMDWIGEPNDLVFDLGGGTFDVSIWKSVMAYLRLNLLEIRS